MAASKPQSVEKHLDKLLAAVEAYKANPTFAALDRKTIRYALIHYPTRADEILRGLVSEDRPSDFYRALRQDEW